MMAMDMDMDLLHYLWIGHLAFIKEFSLFTWFRYEKRNAMYTEFGKKKYLRKDYDPHLLRKRDAIIERSCLRLSNECACNSFRDVHAIASACTGACASECYKEKSQIDVCADPFA